MTLKQICTFCNGIGDFIRLSNLHVNIQNGGNRSQINILLFSNCFNFLSWASTRENLSSGTAYNKGADQPALRRSLISAFVIRVYESTICRLATDEISNF